MIIRHFHYLCFSLCLVGGTHREHVQLVEVDAAEVAHVDGTDTFCQLPTVEKCVKDTKDEELPTSSCMSSKPMHLARTMQNSATKLP